MRNVTVGRVLINLIVPYVTVSRTNNKSDLQIPTFGGQSLPLCNGTGGASERNANRDVGRR